jgi:hypothetical protein
MRLGSFKLHQKTLDSQAGNARLLATPSPRGTAAEIEKAGFSSQEIALHQRRTVVSVDTIFSRAKQKIRKALGVDDVTDAPARPSC